MPSPDPWFESRVGRLEFFILLKVSPDPWALPLFDISLVTQKSTVNENINFADSASGIQPPDLSKLAKNPKNDNDVITFRHDVIVNFSDVVLFLLSSLVNGLSFVSISSLVLELWLFSFIRDGPEIRKSETLPSEFFPIYVDWDELWICPTECKYAFEK